MKLDKNGVALILDFSKRYSTIMRIRNLIKNYFNANDFQNVDMLGLLRRSDDEHYELLLDVLHCGRYELKFMVDLGEKILEAEYLRQKKYEEEMRYVEDE